VLAFNWLQLISLVSAILLWNPLNHLQDLEPSTRVSSLGYLFPFQNLLLEYAITRSYPMPVPLLALYSLDPALRGVKRQVSPGNRTIMSRRYSPVKAIHPFELCLYGLC